MIQPKANLEPMCRRKLKQSNQRAEIGEWRNNIEIVYAVWPKIDLRLRGREALWFTMNESLQKIQKGYKKLACNVQQEQTLISLFFFHSSQSSMIFTLGFDRESLNSFPNDSY